MTHQRERGFLPALRSPDQQNLVKSAPNLDNKSRSTTSKSVDNILGNIVDNCDSLSSVAHPSSANHHYVNISSSSHTIYYEKDMHNNQSSENAKNGYSDNVRKMSTNSSISRERSIESFDYCDDSDQSDHVATVGCFPFGGGSSERKKKYKKLQKVSPNAESEKSEKSNSISFVPGTSEKKSSGSRKNSAIDSRKALGILTQKISSDLNFYNRIKQSLDAVGSNDALDEEEDYVYVRSKRAKNKNKLSMRLQQSLEAIDAYDPEDLGPDCGNRHVKVYSKSIDNISMAGDYQFERNGSQFTRECFLKNGGRSKNSNNDDRNRESNSSGDDSAVWGQNRQY